MRTLVHRKSVPGPVGLRPCGSAQSWNGTACATSCFPRSVQARFARARFKTARLALALLPLLFGSFTAERLACSAISRHCCASPWYLLFKTEVVARRASRSHSAALFLYISARDNIECASLALRSVTYSKIIFAAYKCEMDRVMML